MQGPGRSPWRSASTLELWVKKGIDTLLQEQNLLRRLASNSILPTIEIEVAGDDVRETADRIADWIERVGANLPPEDEATTRVIYPPVG